MKKRKSPIVLVSCLIILIGAVAVFSVAQNSTPPKDTATEHVSEPRSAPSAGDVAGAIKSITKSVKKPIAPVDGDSGAPTIELDPQTSRSMPKPKPNLNGATSSQWYPTQPPK